MRPTGVTARVTSSSLMVQSPISFSAALAGSGPSASSKASPATQAAGASAKASTTARRLENRPARSSQGQEKGLARRAGKAGGKAVRRMACSMPGISRGGRLW